MAEVDFGDSELFEQLDGDSVVKPVQSLDEDEDGLEPSVLQEQLARCQETISLLREENEELKRKLSVVSRPSGLFVKDKFDGPLLQILFMNHIISKQYHQEIEDFVSGLLQKYEKQERDNPEKTTFNINPQPSSFLLEEIGGSSEDTRKIKEAFNVVGSVLYFPDFCCDKLGQPLLNENPQMSDGWELPKYPQAFTQIVSLDGQEVQIKAKRPKACCFNCGSGEHQIKDCPKPRDNAGISMRRKEFMDSCAEAGPNQNLSQRYHTDERFTKFKPGIIGSDLQEALGISDRDLPPFIYRMRQLGYPPGWLKEAELESSGLSLYDGKDTSDGEIEEDPSAQNKSVSYDTSKLISFPGFNIAPPSGVADDWRNFASMPMQHAHQKEVFAHYLSLSNPSNKNGQKRSLSQTGSEKKRQRTSSKMNESATDMEVESGSEDSAQGFNFQPPLPPYCSPPPMPRGTPPSTPKNFIPPPPPTPTPPPLPKGTPPPTPPNRNSPLLLSKANPQAQAASSMDEDVLTLEELEEQQRLIWAALENTDSTNSESDMNTPLNGNSVASSPSRTDTESVTGGKVGVPKTPANSTPPDAFLEAAGHEPDDKDLVPEGSGIVNENDMDIALENAAKPNGTAMGLETSEQEAEASEPAEEAACAPSPLKPGIPDSSKFAEGITPFEYDNMSEATGTYLRLRSVLKNSPRNQQKNKFV